MKANRTRRRFSPCCVAAAALLMMGSDIMRGREAGGPVRFRYYRRDQRAVPLRHYQCQRSVRQRGKTGAP